MHSYLYAHRRHQRHHYLQVFANVLLQRELGAGLENAQAREVLRIKDRSGLARAMWKRFEKSYPLDTNGAPHRPSVAEVRQASVSGIIALRQSSIVAIVSSFETFFLCWALNYLLALLETKANWSDSERDVAMALSPEHQWRPLPGWPWVAERITGLSDRLAAQPHIITDPQTGSPVDSPVSAQLNAFRVMRFWRDFRNRVVHAGGIISAEFHRDHCDFWEELRKPYASFVPPLFVGQVVELWQYAVPAVSATHYRVATWMNDLLIKLSEARRGHVLAPSACEKDLLFSPSTKAPPLLVEGDHEPSCRWIADPAYRQQIRVAQQRAITGA